jgi:deoxyribose-phosphate aldolase
MNKVEELAKMIDHTILHPTATTADLHKECEVAKKYQVASMCVKPYMVPDTVRLLEGSGVAVGCVVGFPAGNSVTDVKVLEAKQACQDGAQEIDMVINVAKAIEGEWDYVQHEIAAVADACHRHDALLKVIFETDYITEEADIVRLCEICTEAKADYVKTSTGFGFVKGDDGKYSYTGATIPTLKLMKQSIGPNVKVKASGGIRTLDALLAVQEVGCERCGATATVTILDEAQQRFGN